MKGMLLTQYNRFSLSDYGILRYSTQIAIRNPIVITSTRFRRIRNINSRMVSPKEIWMTMHRPSNKISVKMRMRNVETGPEEQISCYLVSGTLLVSVMFGDSHTFVTRMEEVIDIKYIVVHQCIIIYIK